MAFLNLRDRVVEAKIAYFGRPQSGRSTNVRALGAQFEAGEVNVLGANGDKVLTFSLSPPRKVNGCDLRVQICTGAQEAAETAVLEDADSIVLVVDATPDAMDENRAALARLRSRLESSPRPPPVVVQINKTDLPDTLAPKELVEALGVEEWPHIVASATGGLGVLETFDHALERALSGMRERAPTKPLVARAPGEGAAATSKPSAAAPSPLIAAEVRDLVTAAVEQALERSIDRWVDERLGTTVERVLAQHLASRVESAVERAATTHLEPALERATSGQQAAFDARLELLAEALRRDPNAIQSRFDELAVEIRTCGTALSAAIEAGADRQSTLSEGLAGVRKSIGDLANDLRRIDSGVRAAERASTDLRKVVDGQAAALAGLGALSSDVAKLAADLGQLPPGIVQSVDGAVALRANVLDRKVQWAWESTSTKLEALEERVEQLTAALTAAIEEAKQRKRGWFG